MEIAEKLAFLLAGILFVAGLWLLYRPGPPCRANRTLAAAVTLAVLTTLAQVAILTLPEILGALVAGSMIGWLWGQRARLAGKREKGIFLVGISGLVAMLVGLSDYWSRQMERNMLPDNLRVFADGVAILIGGIVFAGSVLVWARATNRMGGFKGSGASLRALSVFLLVVGLCLCGVLVPFPEYYSTTISVGILGLVVGFTIILPLQKPDLARITPLLAAGSGLAAAAVGFALSSEITVIGSALFFGVNFAQAIGGGTERRKGIWRMLGGR